jgi:hypothetical protein
VATPHVVGVAALVWSHFNFLTAIQIRNVLESTAKDLGESGRDDKYGHGLVDAKAAYDFLENAHTFSPTESPTPLNCQNGQKKFELEIIHDNHATETSWDVVKACTGETVLRGNENRVLDCLDEVSYVFTIYDSYGDGICCNSGSGSYSVYYDEALIKEGGEFEYQESTIFGSDSSNTISRGRVC